LAVELGDWAAFVELDVADPQSWESALDAATVLFGVPTVLVNSAGVAGRVAVTAELTDEAYRRTVEVNEHGVFYKMRAVIPGMSAAGRGRSITSRRWPVIPMRSERPTWLTPQPNSRSGG
jgi:3alpha(or 20beta)-hydroxysteroid dehydrogenase